MLELNSVHFDDFIPDWNSSIETIDHNVLVLVTEGKVQYTLDGRTEIVDEGELLFIPEGTNRAGTNYQSKSHQKYTLLFYNPIHFLNDLKILQQKKIIKFKVRDFNYVKQRMERLYIANKGDRNFRDIICKGITLELLGLIFKELHTIEISPMKLKYAQKIQGYILKNYRESIDAELLAKLINKSVNYTISIFKDIYGVTPIQYIHQLRIAEACNLLSSSDMSIINISEFLGYYDSAYFSKMFRKHMHRSPMEYRTYC